MLLVDLYVNIIANLIIEQYFTNCRCLYIITDEANSFDYAGNLPFTYIEKNDEADFNNGTIFHHFGCQGIVIRTKTPLTTFAYFENHLRHNMERFNFRKYLFLPSTYYDENIDDIFQLKEITYVSDLLAISSPNSITHSDFYEKEIMPIEPDNMIFIFFTHKYVGIMNNTEKIILDKWFAVNQTFLYGRNLYPDKISNQHGRTLKMACFNYAPYSVIGKDVDHHDGSELKLGLLYAKLHNMTPVIVTDKYEWGDIYENWTGTGVIGNIVEDKADIAFSALYAWSYSYYYLDLTMPVIRSGVTLLVPAPKLAARWLTPMLSYSPELWLAILFVVGFSSFGVFLVLSFYQKNKLMSEKLHLESSNLTLSNRITLSIMYVGKLVLEQPLSRTPVGSAINHIIGFVTILSLLITCTYSGGLASIMTVPKYEAVINTFDDFVKNGEMQWGATSVDWITSIQQAKYPDFQNIANRYVTAPGEKLRELSLTNEFALAVERLHYGSFAIGRYIQQDVIQKFHLMKEDLFWEQVVMMTRKSSILLPSLNKLILNVFEFGLFSTLETQSVFKEMDPVVERAVKYYEHHANQERELVKLKFVHVQGAFAILFLGYVLSIIAFIYEKIKFRREKMLISRTK